MMSYFLHYDDNGIITGAPYNDAVHGKLIPIYNMEPIKDEEGNVIHKVGEIQIGTALDLSAIPTPYIEISNAEHGDWMQNQSTRKIDIETKKLVEYTPTAPAPVIITPSTNQDLADVWEAIFALSATKEGGE